MRNPAERLLAETLRARADRASYDPTAVGEVATAAGVIRRRRRRAVAVSSALAVAALTLPTAVFLDGHRSSTPGPAEPSPSQTQEPSRPSPAPMQRGPDPRIGYVHDNVFVSPDGSRHRIEMPHGAGITAITPYRGGFLVADDRYFEGTVGLWQLAGDGTVLESWCGSGSPVLDADLLRTSWVATICPETGTIQANTIHRGSSTGLGEEVTQDIPGVGIRLVGTSGDDVVYTGLFGAGAWVTDLVHQPREIPGLVTARGVSASTGLVSGEDAEGNGVVVDPSDGTIVQTIPDWQPGRFSPDGRYVEAIQLRRSTPPVAIVDMHTGETVARALGGHAGSPNPVAAAWEDATHLLVVVEDPAAGERYLVRLGVDGSIERATDLLPIGEQLVLAATP